MMSDTKGSRISDNLDDYVVFDLETTGLSTLTEQIVEIAAVKVRGGQIVDEFQTLVNPGCHIPYQVSAINNITDDMVADAPTVKDAISLFIDFIQDEKLVGHNIHSFDLKFIYRDLEKYFDKTIDNDYVDTLLLSKRKLPKMKHNLGVLAEHYGIDTNGAHRALADSIMNHKVYECLKKEI